MKFPASCPLLLIFPALRITDAGFDSTLLNQMYSVPGRCPNVFTSDGAGVTADAFVQIQDHADLSTNLHTAPPFLSASSSIQSTLFIFLTQAKSSRLGAIVP